MNANFATWMILSVFFLVVSALIVLTKGAINKITDKKGNKSLIISGVFLLISVVCCICGFSFSKPPIKGYMYCNNCHRYRPTVTEVIYGDMPGLESDDKAADLNIMLNGPYCKKCGSYDVYDEKP